MFAMRHPVAKLFLKLKSLLSTKTKEFTDLRSPGGSTGGEGALISMNGSIIGIGKS